MTQFTIEERLDRLVAATRGKLLQAVDDNCAECKDLNRGFLRRTFSGYCGLAQCVAGYALQDTGENVRALATQAIPGWDWDTHYGHAALTLALKDNGDDKLYLIDPTFAQFTEEQERRSKGDAPIIPGEWMRFSKEGREIVRDLTTRGYTELTPERAKIYLGSFCPGGKSPFATPAEAFEFCKNPPWHIYHFRYAEESDRYERPQLEKQGYLLEGFRF